MVSPQKQGGEGGREGGVNHFEPAVYYCIGKSSKAGRGGREGGREEGINEPAVYYCNGESTNNRRNGGREGGREGSTDHECSEN